MAFQRPFLISLRRDDSSEPWGFRLDGGGVTNQPVAVQQVLERSLAEKAGLHEGDQVIQVGRINVQGRTLSEVQELIITCRNRVELFIIREDLLRDRRENEPLTVKAVVHSPYNSPLQLYSQDNVADTLATQALILSDPDVQPNHLGPKSPPTVIHSNVLDALREQGEKGPRLNGEIVTTPPRKKKQPPPVPPKPQSPKICQSPPAKAAVCPGNMEQLQYQNYSTYHREEKRTSQRTSSYGDYEDDDTDLSIMYPQQKTFKSQTSFTPQQPEPIRAQQQTVRSQQTFQQESRLRDYQQQREEDIRRAEFVRQQELQQQEAFEQQQKLLREQQQRQTEEQRQRQVYEQQQRQIREQQLAREQLQTREQQSREQQLREQRAREQQALEQQRARELQLREQRAREQQALEQQRAREQRAREQQAREQQERLAAQQRQRYEQQQQSREAQTRQQSQAQMQARQYEQQRLAEQRKAQEAYEQQRQAQLRGQQQQQPQYYAQPQHNQHHDMEHHKKMTSTTRVVPANLGSPTTQRRGGCVPTWPPKNSSVRELPRTGFSPTFVQERGSKEFVWPPPNPEDQIVKEPIRHVHGHAGEAWHPQSTSHASRPLVPRSPTPTRRCGDAIWPPPHVQAAEANAHYRPAPQPVCRRGKFDDYIHQNTISNVPPTYRVPPGTVHVVY